LFGATNNTPVTTKEKEVELEKLWGWLNSGWRRSYTGTLLLYRFCQTRMLRHSNFQGAHKCCWILLMWLSYSVLRRPQDNASNKRHPVWFKNSLYIPRKCRRTPKN
jgi:hypothetical protein